MADKRKPVLVLMLRIPGTKNKHKIELFDGRLFTKYREDGYYDPDTRQLKYSEKRYRIKVDGKWVGSTKPLTEIGKKSKGKGSTPKLYTWYEFRDLMWKSLTHSMMPAMREAVYAGRTRARDEDKAKKVKPPKGCTKESLGECSCCACIDMDADRLDEEAEDDYDE